MNPNTDPVDYALARQAAGVTIGALFARCVRRAPGRIALQQGPHGLTYAQLDERSNRLCQHLAGLGIGRGDRVAILSENRTEYVELLIAAAKLGAIAACQNWRLRDEELAHCLALVTPRLILASPRHAEAARRCGGAVPLLCLGAEYEQALQAATAEPVEDRCDPEDGVVILYTSGTTGMPKGALISQRAEIARAAIQAMDLPHSADEHFVAWAPLFHMVSTDTVFMTLMQGGKVIVTDGFDADELAAIVARERLGRREQIAEVTRLLGAPYINSFGATETGYPPASLATIPVGVVPTSLDKQQSSLCRIRLVDADDREVPDGEPGELTIRTPALFSGYWNNPDANREDFRGGWFHMGDVFRRNPDGTLSFVDRRKYLIKSGGENIYPAEIERVLLSEPRVADAVVVRRPDPTWGEVPVAFVVRRDPTLDAAALQALCRQQIAGYKVPKEVHFVDDAALPRSTTGKIMRHELEQRLPPVA